MSFLTNINVGACLTMMIVALPLPSLAQDLATDIISAFDDAQTRTQMDETMDPCSETVDASGPGPSAPASKPEATSADGPPANP